MSDRLIKPHGGTLVDLMVGRARAAEITACLYDSRSWDLTPRQLCDLELLLTGGFSPLRGFLGRSDYESVCQHMRLSDGTLWPIPVTLDVPDEVAAGLSPGEILALRDPEGVALAALRITEIWRPDLKAEAEAVFGTLDIGHPGIDHLLSRTHPWHVGGTLEGLQVPVHHDYGELRHTPGQLRAEFERRAWHRVVAFQTRNPMHRAHLELTVRAAKEVGGSLLVHPVVGMTKPGDVDHYTRVRCYQAIMPSYA
ncbi:MAG: adenylyltransferase, partial [Chloroflexi bacterium]